MISFFFLLTQRTLGQELLSELPTTKEEFVLSEKYVLNTIEWLESNPMDKDGDKRKKQNALLVSWITNSPTVTIEINYAILPFTENNPELLVIFMGGWTKYSLQNNYSKDIVQGTVAGLKSIIRVYNNLPKKKVKEIEKLIKIDNKGGLEDWVKDKLNKK
jgi:hypothetical protein